MSDNSDNKKEYKGPGKFTAAIGRGSVESVVVGAAGALIGVGIGAFTHNKSAEYVTADTIRGLIKNNPKLVYPLIGGEIGNLVGFVHGAYRGVKNVAAEQEQVASLNTELAEKTAALKQQKSFVDAVTAIKAEPDKSNLRG